MRDVEYMASVPAPKCRPALDLRVDANALRARALAPTRRRKRGLARPADDALFELDAQPLDFAVAHSDAALFDVPADELCVAPSDDECD